MNLYDFFYTVEYLQLRYIILNYNKLFRSLIVFFVGFLIIPKQKRIENMREIKYKNFLMFLLAIFLLSLGWWLGLLMLGLTLGIFGIFVIGFMFKTMGMVMSRQLFSLGTGLFLLGILIISIVIGIFWFGFAIILNTIMYFGIFKIILFFICIYLIISYINNRYP